MTYWKRLGSVDEREGSYPYVGTDLENGM